MHSLRMPPAAKLLIPFCAGIVLGVRFDLPALWVLAASAFGLVLWLWSYRQHHHRLSAAAAALLVLLLAAVRTAIQYHLAAPNEISRFVSAEPVAVEGVVSSAVANRSDHRSFVLKVDSAWSRTHHGPAQGRVYVRLYDSTAVFKYGDRLLLTGFLRRPAGERNPGDFDYSRYLAAQGIFATLSVFIEPPLRLSQGQGAWLDQRVFMPLAGFIHQLLYKALPFQQAALLFGLLVGDRSAVAQEVEEDFRNAGVIHVLSVSGMHVGFVVAALFFLLKWLPLRPALRTLLLLAGIWFYAHITGLDSPVARAALMAGLFLLAPLLQRRADPVNIIAVAALILLMLHPLQLFLAGFQLSFAACLGIVLLYQRLRIYTDLWFNRRGVFHRAARYLVEIVAISACAQIATLPIILYYFNSLPLISLAANIPVIPLSGVILIGGFAAVLAEALLPGLGVRVLKPVGALLTLLINMVHGFSVVPFSHLTVPRPSPWGLWLIFAACGLLFYWQEPRVRKWLLAVTILLLNLMVWRQVRADPHALRVTFFDVGQGDAALFEFPDRRTLLVDGGDRTAKIDYGERVIGPYLRRRGIRRITDVVITHPHADHLGGIAYIVKHFSVGRILSSPVVYQDALTKELDSLAVVRGVRRQTLCRGDSLGGFRHSTVLVLNPACCDAAATDDDLNDASIVLKVLFGRTSFLLTGDAGTSVEAQWLGWKELIKSDVVKVAHHGSPSASSESFCRCASPRYAVISVAEYNRFSLPSPEVMARWEAVAGQVVRTADSGAVVFVSNGERMQRIR